MSGIAGKWTVQRYEQPFNDGYSDRLGLTQGKGKVCESWQEACEAVTLAIGPNCLQVGVEPTTEAPVVFERDGVVIVVYLKLVC